MQVLLMVLQHNTERWHESTEPDQAMPMNRATDIGWVEPAKPIRGLDHLGVQAPCIALYAQLLPGITNVTDRARYYSFYPWLIRSFEQRYRDHSIDEFRRVLRRAECLFALIAIRHARVSADKDDGRHGIGMVGRLSLLRIPEDAHTINLEEHAALEGSNRYFLNKLGGLGQYYFGPLRDLRVLFATVATHVAGDQEAQETLTGAVGRTVRKGVDAASWLSTHLALAGRLAKVIAKPGFYPKAERPARPGDLVILGSALDPRVRVVLDVAPSGTTSKISVLDRDTEDGERQFLGTHVNYLAWWEKQIAPRRFAEG